MFWKLATHKYIIAILPIIIFTTFLIRPAIRLPMWMDEYVFYRITSQLPSTATTIDWFYEDNPKVLYYTFKYPNLAMGSMEDRKQIQRNNYDTPAYVHIPLANYLMYPLVRGVNFLADEGVIPHIEDTESRDSAEPITIILRIVPIILFMASMWLIFRLLHHKVGASAYLFFVPGLFSIQGVYMQYTFYWDSFMWFFLILTLYLMETRPNSKWVFIAACCLANTKQVAGLLLLIPLAIQNRKIILAALSTLPYYIATGLIAHDFFWIFNFMFAKGQPAYSWIYYHFNTSIIGRSGVIYYGIMTLPIFAFIRKYPAYVGIWIIMTAYAWGIGAGADKLAVMIYAGALIFPLVAYELKIIDRVMKLSKGTAEA